MDRTMKISGNNHNHALIHNRKSVPAELLKLSREKVEERSRCRIFHNNFSFHRALLPD